jgi:hypothetical protein
MMRRFEAKLKSYLEARSLLLEEMRSLLSEQKRFLNAGDVCGCAEKGIMVDDLVASLKSQDYEIARLELLSDDLDVGAIVGRDGELRNLIRKAAGVTIQNAALVDELAGSLSRRRERLERGLHKTVDTSSTGA